MGFPGQLVGVHLYLHPDGVQWCRFERPFYIHHNGDGSDRAINADNYCNSKCNFICWPDV